MAAQFWKYIPKTPSEKGAFAFIIIMGFSSLYYMLFVVHPTIFQEATPWYCIHLAFIAFEAMNVLGNFWYILSTDTTEGNVVLPSTLKAGWRYCTACEANFPPRSHHCHTCNRCILQRDHHCFFTGNCIGFANHRYYLCFTLHVAISGFYAVIMNADYTWAVLGGLSWTSLVSMALPIVSWILGLSETYTFAVAFLSAGCIIAFLLASALTGYHCLLIFNGQTTYERTHNVKQYNLGWMENVHRAVGENWIAACLFPFAPLKVKGDGFKFPQKGEFEDIKDM
ncbi:probable palmitoyltransferase ZDHHC24 [Lingula anatina]|uniref:Palmitoyltransferase n=1 Tax=Lingula anatina TaxID=7574 RepID=A0A1S3HP07_LINAN|nr:probable palmitoyltransferase ZDHHC24 [Lingula anatina]|eukprot:XP_013387788.1 probable palmitoyltransferase ZDHHC24 [Lingula anatina]